MRLPEAKEALGTIVLSSYNRMIPKKQIRESFITQGENWISYGEQEMKTHTFSYEGQLKSVVLNPGNQDPRGTQHTSKEAKNGLKD